MAAPMPRIGVLLSVFNGEAYLPAQLDSILAQDYQNLIIILRDDGSTDASREIVSRYIASHSPRMVLMPDDGRRLGACGSFAALMEFALTQKPLLGLSPAYLAFSDQDDVWDPDHLSTGMSAMLEQESRVASPVLVHSDLRVVDAHLVELAPSLIAYQGLQPWRMNFGRVLVANAVTGCTMLINESLARLALPIPPQAIMHDWWIAVMARLQGETRFLPRATVSYRQHGANALGARQRVQAGSAGELVRRALTRHQDGDFSALAGQSCALLASRGELLDWRTRAIARLALGMDRGGLAARVVYRLVRLL